MIKGVVLLNCVCCQFGLSGSVWSVDYVELLYQFLLFIVLVNMYGVMYRTRTTPTHAYSYTAHIMSGGADLCVKWGLDTSVR